ncbi:peptide-methionine (S)-S-oxide reductase MsrA [Furfurilactobacillus siliginis]|uniref:Peptide methionine sulfoxide reductase MsrA n=1 Tax=Furfurilactobacillus siliginis TaxID=348151 RepID=A0A0R2KVV1_9LACO|nr:peptide-methionine (S)-S-oxide reductase MsrA [Furfurilactobacillus siliginis]KRN93665.1 peptide methionine sulfoxide reductase [Furfurilactobacillus siliginis]GEK28369.1 peptide methionine sulfoxide reductase MsrA [Furfurilactobacillus siliginis]
MKVSQDDILERLYNLILNPATRDWERQQLVNFKTTVGTGQSFNGQLSMLISYLRPLAIRNNLTPDMMDFYQLITDGKLTSHEETDGANASRSVKHQEQAIFAGGCFWCTVEPFDQIPGIISVLSGYTGGHLESPSYDDVISRTSGHVEAVEITYDSQLISYQELLDIYWKIIDPTDANGQFEDRGENYRPIIFYENKQQEVQANDSLQATIDSGKYTRPIVVEIRPAQKFWPAENYHQEFYKKNPRRYRAIMRARRELMMVKKVERMVDKVTGRGNKKAK